MYKLVEARVTSGIVSLGLGLVGVEWMKQEWRTAFRVQNPGRHAAELMKCYAILLSGGVGGGGA